jgi:Tol biopolymer transport system component
MDVHIAPQETGAAVSLVDSSGYRDLWVLEFARSAYSRVTSGSTGFVGVWSPDGKKIAYHAANLPFLLVRNANATGQEEVLLKSRFTAYINDWSLDGRYLVYTESTPDTQYDLWLLPTFGDHKPVPFLKTTAAESHGQISPNCKWIAYTSNESGREEVYVRSFPAGARKWPVSNNGGNYPRWRRNGKELFYRAPDGRLMSAMVRPAGQDLEFGSPVALFRILQPQGAFAYPYDVSSDGQRILALAPSEINSGSTPLTVLINWQAGLKK